MKKSYYTATVHRWSQAGKKFIPYCFFETLEETSTGDINALNAIIITRFPVYLERWQKVDDFCRALAGKDWKTAKALIDPLPDAAPIEIAEAKSYSADCKKFPPLLSWNVYTSPHDPDYICFVIPVSGKVYTVVTNSNGINKMATGEFD